MLIMPCGIRAQTSATASLRRTGSANSSRYDRYDRLEDKLHPLVGGDEAEPLVEPVRGAPGLVRGQLDQRAAPGPCLADGPFEHGRAEPLAPVGPVHPDRLDLGAQRAAPGQAGQ